MGLDIDSNSKLLKKKTRVWKRRKSLKQINENNKNK